MTLQELWSKRVLLARKVGGGGGGVGEKSKKHCCLYSEFLLESLKERSDIKSQNKDFYPQ